MARERKGAVKRSSVIQSPTHDRCVIRRPVFIGTLRLVSHLDLMARPRCTVARMFRGGGEKSGGGDERKEERTSRARLMDGKRENRIRFARSRIVEA